MLMSLTIDGIFHSSSIIIKPKFYEFFLVEDNEHSGNSEFGKSGKKSLRSVFRTQDLVSV